MTIITVRMFGALADRAQREMRVVVTDGARAADVVGAVRDAYPGAAAILARISIAVNREVAHADRRVHHGDEVALMPPVAGGAPRVLVGLRERPSVDEAMASVSSPRVGGTALFVGTVRDRSGDAAVERLEYSAYEEMADGVLAEIADEAVEKWGVERVAVLHGVGRMHVGDVTVVVACSAAHRAEALDACRYVIDEVKSRVPIWKKEIGPTGERWVGMES